MAEGSRDRLRHGAEPADWPQEWRTGEAREPVARYLARTADVAVLQPPYEDFSRPPSPLLIYHPMDVGLQPETGIIEGNA